ncbi:MAG: peptidoglycan binding domain-containing protein [Eubacteriales bacterium]|nr:peptidoglycan binding domain-containing protein [Eubacteriales bacterium]
MRKKFLLAAAGVAVSLYVAVAVYFGFHFYGGTILYGADCSRMTSAQAKQAVAEKLQEYEMQICGREDMKTQITAGQIGLKFRDDGGVDRLLKEQYSFLWPVMTLLNRQSSFSAAFTYDQEMVKEALNGLDCMDETKAVPPSDAYITAEGSKFVVAPEVIGTTLDSEKTYQAVCDALDAGKSSISLEEADCYKKPAVFKEDEALNREADAINVFMGADITYDFGDRQEIVDAGQIREWLVKQADGTYALDENLVGQYVTSLANTYDTFGLGREFYTSLGYTVSLFGGDYGWLMDQEATLEQLLEAIRKKYTGRMEPVYIYSAMSRDTNDIGDTYVEVCISQQRMWCYENGSLVVDTPVVTGNPNTNHGTPAGGVWAIDSKMRNYTLRGEGYAAPVDYWMAFNGDVGIHDLVSRSEFGGSIYLTNGSHGCVNTPYDQVQIIYSVVSVGTPVIVYE